MIFHCNASEAPMFSHSKPSIFTDFRNFNLKNPQAQCKTSFNTGTYTIYLFILPTKFKPGRSKNTTSPIFVHMWNLSHWSYICSSELGLHKISVLCTSVNLKLYKHIILACESLNKIPSKVQHIYSAYALNMVWLKELVA